MIKTDHVIVHDATCGQDAYACECLHCGQKQRFVLPIRVESYVEALGKFQRAHGRCVGEIDESSASRDAD